MNLVLVSKEVSYASLYRTNSWCSSGAWR